MKVLRANHGHGRQDLEGQTISHKVLGIFSTEQDVAPQGPMPMVSKHLKFLVMLIYVNAVDKDK